MIARAALAVLAVSAPWLVAAWRPRAQRYIVHVLIFTALFAALALSYDLVVGHVGSLSLAHPAFFGVGAYTAAILATRAQWPFLADLAAAAVLLAGVVAALAGVPLFRLAEHAFAVGTLGFALVASIVATNWVEVTRGPLCITGHPQARDRRCPASARSSSPRCPPTTGSRLAALAVVVAALSRHDDVPARPRHARRPRQRAAGRGGGHRSPPVPDARLRHRAARSPGAWARSTRTTSRCSAPRR